MDTRPTPRTSAFRFDHVNLVAGDASPLQRLFVEVMGMQAGDRPPFPFPGEWLYGDAGRALLHVVHPQDAADADIGLGHVAFRTDEAASAVIARLQAAGLPHRAKLVPRDGDVQLFIPLPGGLVIELDCPADPSLLAAEALR